MKMDENFPVGMKVLAVDHDSTYLDTLAPLLRDCKYQVVTANTAIEALEILGESKHKFELIMSDVEAGFELLQQLDTIPVLLLSSEDPDMVDDKEVIMKGINHGACHYMSKSVRIQDLKSIWQHVFRRELNKMRKKVDGRVVEQQPKKPRFVWTQEHHHNFVAAVRQLGVERSVPKKILELMNDKDIKRQHVASHLQKYKIQLKKSGSLQASTSASGHSVSDAAQNYNGHAQLVSLTHDNTQMRGGGGAHLAQFVPGTGIGNAPHLAYHDQFVTGTHNTQLIRAAAGTTHLAHNMHQLDCGTHNQAPDGDDKQMSVAGDGDLLITNQSHNNNNGLLQMPTPVVLQDQFHEYMDITDQIAGHFPSDGNAFADNNLMIDDYILASPKAEASCGNPAMPPSFLPSNFFDDLQIESFYNAGPSVHLRDNTTASAAAAAAAPTHLMINPVHLRDNNAAAAHLMMISPNYDGGRPPPVHLRDNNAAAAAPTQLMMINPNYDHRGHPSVHLRDNTIASAAQIQSHLMINPNYDHVPCVDSGTRTRSDLQQHQNHSINHTAVGQNSNQHPMPTSGNLLPGEHSMMMSVPKTKSHGDYCPLSTQLHK